MRKVIKIGIILFFNLIFLVFFQNKVLAINSGEEFEYKEARITKISEEKMIEVMGKEQLYQKLELEILENKKMIEVENGDLPLANIIEYSKRDMVLVNLLINPDGNERYVIVDFIRKDSLVLLVIIFVALLLIVAKWKGLFAIFGMIFTFFVVFSFVLPQILAGGNPILIAILASIIIIPVSFYLAHGFNKKTTIAIIASLISLMITIVLASIFTKIGHLSGLSSEEAGMLSLDRVNLNMKGILLAGIVVGALGVLDDITISQAAIVDELVSSTKLTKTKDLYVRSMVIGKDHIGSMVNTLVLAYAGAFLPLLLVFVNSPHPFVEVINYEFIAEEIIRTLVGSIGLILAVPITSYIAARSYRDK